MYIMQGLGTFLIIFGLIGALISLVMCFFCNVKLGESETDEDIIDANRANKFYRIIFFDIPCAFHYWLNFMLHLKSHKHTSNIIEVCILYSSN